MKRNATYGQESRSIESRISRALESAPVIAIDPDFARRVASSVPARAVLAREEPWRGRSIGSSVMWSSAAVLLVAMLLVTHLAGASPHSGQWIEVGLALEFTVLATGLSLHAQRES